VAGYLIAVIALALPLSVGVTGVVRPKVVIGLGAVMAFGWAVALVARRAEDGQGNHIVPVWFLASLVAILFALWLGGLWLGLRLRKTRTR
jgi:cytochrome c oxidase assembly factor CtaG